MKITRYLLEKLMAYSLYPGRPMPFGSDIYPPPTTNLHVASITLTSDKVIIEDIN